MVLVKGLPTYTWDLLEQNFYRITTVIFQTSWRFSSASRRKLSHDDFYTDIDWIFKINEIWISKRKLTNTLTNHNQCVPWVFLKDFTKQVDSHIVRPKSTSSDKFWYTSLNFAYIHAIDHFFFYFIEIEDPIVFFIKFLDCTLKCSVTLFEKL